MGGLFGGGGLGQKGDSTTDSSQKTVNTKQDVVSTGGGVTLGNEAVGGSSYSFGTGGGNTVVSSDPSTVANALTASSYVSGRSLDTVDRTNAGAFDTVNKTVSSGFTFGTDALKTVERTVGQANALLEKTSAGFTEKLASNAGEAPSKVAADSLAKLTKTGLIVVAVIATGYVASKYFENRKAA
jgi:hypothetical protein